MKVSGSCTPATCSGANGCWCDDACCSYNDCCKNFYIVCKVPVIESVVPNSASTSPTSVLVTLSGSSFGSTIQPLTWVKMGPVNATAHVVTTSMVASSWTAARAVLILPAGSGANHLFWMRNEFGNANVVMSPYFSYNAPKLVGLTPDNAPTEGDTLVTLTGTDFGPANATVQVQLKKDSTIMMGTVVSWTHTKIVFRSPEGEGGQAALTAIVTGQGSNELQFRFSAPQITSITPSTGILAGGAVTINGSSFGTSGATVAIGLGSCAVSSQTHTRIICTAPVGCCTGQQVRITKEGQTSNVMNVAYAAPTVSAISTQNGPTAGGVAVTLTGTNFYTEGTISFGGVVCPSAACTVTSWTNLKIALTLPVGQGASLPVTVYVGDQQSTSGPTYSYAKPVVTGISPNGGSTAGGVSITITGSNFGTTATVTVGGASCPVTARVAHTSLTCTLPAGSGTNKALVVTVAGQSSTGAVYNYGAPVISTVTPVTGSTAGGYLVAITGSNFSTTGVITIGGVNCPYTSWTQTSIECAMAAGAGKNLPVKVTVSGQTGTASQTFSFNPPIITTTTPTEGYTGGGETLTVTGDNFGTGGTVYINGVECPTFSHTHTEISCTIPVGRGTDLGVSIDIGGQLANSPNTFTYRAPTIAQVSPLASSSAGGTLITVTGTSFDTGGSISIGSYSVSSASATSWGHSQIIFPAPPGEGKNLAITITTTGSKTYSTAGIFSYAAPAISSISPTKAATKGGVSMTISGTSFGLTPSVSVGGIDCPITSRTHVQIVCTLPAGQGVSRSVVVTAGLQPSSAAVFSYSDPVITNVTPAEASTAGGISVTLTGTSFGTANGVVMFNAVGCPITSQNHEKIVCTLPAGQGIAAVTLVLDSSQISNVFNYRYHAPVINSIGPATPFLTQGGENLTIYGQHFGSETPIVQVSGKDCVVTSFGQTEIVCTTPPNEGTGLTVLVIVGGQSATAALYNTGVPTITALPTATSKRTIGGGTVTITGTNFGLSGTATIGGLACQLLTRSHTQITCTLAPGAGVDLPVVVTVQSRSNVQNGFSKFSYDPISIDASGGVLPLSSATIGGGYLTISGDNFGPSGPGTLLVGSRNCYPIGTGWSHTQIICTIPSGQGKDLSVSLTRSGETAVAAELFSYLPPALTSLTPTSIETSGNVPITISGTNLGTSATVMVGSVNCPVASQTHTQVVCTPTGGSGIISAPVTVTVSDQTAPEVMTLEFKPPSVSNINPSNGVTNGGTAAVITGTSFGSVAGTVTIGSFVATIVSWSHTQIQIQTPEGFGKSLPVKVIAQSGLESAETATFDYRDPSISTFSPSTRATGGGSRSITISGNSLTNGGAGITKSVTIDGKPCTVTSWSHTSIVCDVPEGQGQGLLIRVSVNGIDANTLLFSYAPPQISSYTPAEGPTAGNVELTLVGSSFGTSGAVVKVGANDCPIVSQTHGEIVCQLPSGSSSNNELTVTIGTEVSNTLFFSYRKPTVSSLNPNHGITDGGYHITVIGENFGANGAAVSVGGVSCPIISQTHEEIVCVAPEGDGQNKLIQVGLGSLFSSETVNFNYDGPTVTSISPIGGPTTGNIVIVVTGTSFGLDPIVTIGGATCVRQTRSHSEVTCLVPAGQGANQDVVLRAGAQSSTSPTKFSYDAARITGVNPATGGTAGGTTITVTGSSFGLSGTIRINGNICALVPGSYTHTSARCVVPAGGGNNLAVTLNSGNQDAIENGVFSYSPPVASTITPANGPTAGGIPITIAGSNFALGGTVTIGGKACDLAGAGWSHNRIECTLPDGFGTNQEVIVTATTVSARASPPILFSYDGPILTSVEPASIDTSGLVDITITGSNFGSNMGAISVTVNGNACSVTSITAHTDIVCTAPAGSGTNVPILVTVGTLTSITPLSLSYNKPRITSVSGCSDDGVVTVDCSVSGTSVLTITGASFGTGSLIVNVNNKPCSNVVLTTPHSVVTCEVTPSVGYDLPVIISTGSLTSDPFLGVSFTGPKITPGTIELISDGPTTLSGTNHIDVGATYGGDLIGFAGQHFGNDAGAITVQYGIAPDYTLHNCVVQPASTDTQIICMTEAGVGANHVFTVSVDNALVGLQTSPPGTDTMSYPAPAIIPYTLRLASDGIKTNELIGTVSQGQVVRFDANFIGTDASLIQVVYAKSPSSQEYNCIAVSIISESGQSGIQCTTGTNPGDEGPYYFKIKVLNQWSEYGTDTYTYPTPPSVTTVVGCPTTDGDATADCPTEGNVVLTITGDKFSASATTVRVGSYDCSPVLSVTLNEIQCQLPAGVGANLPIVVTVGSLFSPARSLVTYAAPVLTSISGCTGAGSSTTRCPRSGSMPTITINGNYFGNSGAVVFVGDQQVATVTHSATSPQTQVTFVLPPGFGLDRDILLLQSGGQSATGVRVSYKSCAAGTYEADGACTPCPEGSITDAEGMYACTACTPGRFQPNTGRSICQACTAGTAQPLSGQISCNACSDGYYAATSGLTECAPCRSGTLSNAAHTDCVQCTPGRYATLASAATICDECEPGRYSSSGAVSCAYCGPGTFSAAGAHECTKCSIGYVQPNSGQSSCTGCGDGTYMDTEGQASCLACPGGSYVVGTHNTGCDMCSGGTYSVKPSESLTGPTTCPSCDKGYYNARDAQQTCLQCPQGTYNDGTGKTECTECEPGKYADALGATICKECEPGRYSDISASVTCLPCDVGHFSIGTMNTACSPCAEGEFQDQTGKSVCKECTAGTYNAMSGQPICIPCESGTFSKVAKATKCTQCEKGTYSQRTSSVGPTLCSECTEGKFSESEGQQQCASCPVGTYSNTPKAESCLPCAAGKFNRDVGASVCQNCAQGSYSAARSPTCTACGPGTYASATTVSVCSSCEVGRFASQSSATVCSKCTEGTYTSQTGQSVCLKCAIGRFSATPEATFCSSCAAGRFNPTPGMSACQVCDTGRFTNAPGQTVCVPCPRGEYASALESTACTPCEAGKFGAVTGLYQCSECGQGQYTPTTRLTACLSCAAGTYQAGTAASHCTACEEGKFNPAARASTCTECDLGTYAAIRGQRACTHCEAGKYQDELGKTLCKPCAKGKATAVTKSETCSPCTQGKFAASEGTVSCSACPVGQFANIPEAQACQLCPAGRYQDESGSADCKLCPAGSITSDQGQVTCTACSSGRYAPTFNLSVCSTCEAGKFSVAGAGSGPTACTPCDAGTIQPNSGQASCSGCPAGSFGDGEGCTLCEPGKYQPDPGQLSCLPCPEGTYSSESGALACVPCGLGTYQPNPNSISCDPCPIGRFAATTRATVCGKCAPGKVAKSLGAAKCVDCPAGSYTAETSPGVFASDTCTACPTGKFQPNAGKTICQDCAQGYYIDTVGQVTCIACPAGSANALTGQASCELCAKGKYTSEPAQLICISCTEGKYAPEPGSYSCLDCPAGNYGDGVADTECKVCESGKYQSEAGKSICLVCGPGTYTGGEGLTACLNCAAGEYTDEDSQASCTLCPMGKYQPEPGRSGCIDCSAGRYSASLGSLSCRSCPAGTFSDATNAMSCESCPPGSYQDETGMTECKLCEAGKASDGIGQTRCIPCNSGYYSDEPGAQTCEVCQPGTYSVQIGNSGPQSCTSCSAGQYQPSSGQERCIDCPTGTYSDESKAFTCKSCEQGRFNQRTGVSTCAPCEIGKFTTLEASVQCEECPVGRYQDDEGKTECKDCDRGHYQDITSATVCKACSPGTYQGSVGQSECLPCQMGKASDQSGMEACPDCEAGRYSEIYGQRSCDKCPAGRFQSQPGQSRCNPCQPGSFSDGTGDGKQCTDCPAGRAQNLPEQETCTECNPGEYMPESGQARCLACPPGSYGILPGQESCIACEPGKFQSTPKQSTCEDCDIGRYSAYGAADCKVCEGGSVNAVRGSPTCHVCDATVSQANLIRTECLCNSGYFLPNYEGLYSNGYETGTNNFKCEGCLQGADCRTVGTKWSTLASLPGWWRPTSTSRNFYRCALPSYCPGGEAAGTDYATGEAGTPCADHRTGPMCQACEPGYKSGIGGTCEACPDSVLHWVLMLLLLVFVIVAIIFSVYLLWRGGDSLVNQINTGRHEDELSDNDLDYDEDLDQSTSDDSSSDSSTAKKGKDEDDGLESESIEESKGERVVLDSIDPYTTENFEKAYPRPKPPEDSITYKLKILVSFLQIATNVGSGLEIQWPDTYKSFVLFFDFANVDYILSSITSAECYSAIDYYSTFGATVIFPALVLFCILVFWVIPRHFYLCCYRHMTVQQNIRSKMRSWQLSLYFLFLIYPSVSSTIIYHFVCKDIVTYEKTYSYLMQDLRVECYDDRWYTLAYISIPLIILYPIGIPAYFFYLLYKNKDDLSTDRRIQAQFGFLYMGYRDETWWWELVDLTHKLFQTSLLSFFPDDVRLPMGMAVAILYMISILLFCPYISKANDAFSLLCQNLIFLLMLAGYFFYDMGSATLSASEDIGMSVCLLVATAIFLAMFVYLAGSSLLAMARSLRQHCCPAKVEEKDLDRLKAAPEQPERAPRGSAVKATQVNNSRPSGVATGPVQSNPASRAPDDMSDSDLSYSDSSSDEQDASVSDTTR